MSLLAWSKRCSGFGIVNGGLVFGSVLYNGKARVALFLEQRGDFRQSVQQGTAAFGYFARGAERYCDANCLVALRIYRGFTLHALNVERRKVLSRNGKRDLVYLVGLEHAAIVPVARLSWKTVAQA
ncbi:MAG TPA: hypothetical protein VLR47_07915 [Rhodospirillales bacterium]|nr:hypothetical protein [Rhodospirillales bacterium]